MTPLAVAHRAGNSLAGLRAAHAVGADVVECDVHEHRGRLEVRHLKTAGPLPFLWDRWEVRPASTPRLGLAELLAADPYGSTFMLDLKGRRPDVARSVARVLRAQPDERPVLVCTRFWPALDELAGLPFVRPVLSARNRVELELLRRRLAGAAAQPAGVSVHRSLLDAATVAELHRGVDLVMTWPVNDTDTLRATLATGVSGIISDEPDVLVELLRRRGAG